MIVASRAELPASKLSTGSDARHFSGPRAMRKNAPIRGTLLLLWLCALSSMFALSQTLGRQSLEQIVSRMQSVQREARNNPEYRLLREYKLSVSGADTPSSQVLAEIKYIPPG